MGSEMCIRDRNVILPFRDEFPKDTELYKLLTTKPSEVSHYGETG